jgi:hypothetical protein
VLPTRRSKSPRAPNLMLNLLALGLRRCPARDDPQLQGHEEQRGHERRDHQTPRRRSLRLVLPALLLGPIQTLVVLTAQPGEPGLDLADALIDRPLISPVYVLGDDLI